VTRVLVTDADNRSALAATRSLGRQGCQVHTGGLVPRSLSAVSRHSAGFLRYPDPVREPDAFVAAVHDYVRREGIELLLPMTEVTTLLLGRSRAALPASCVLPFADVEAIARASDKHAVLELARSLEVPAPASWSLLRPADLAAVLPVASYPAVIKPSRSRVWTPGGWISTGVDYAPDRATLERKVRELPEAVFPVLIQERIQGPGVGVFAAFDRGTPVAMFAHRRLREKPPSGGVSVLRESAPLDPDAAAHATRLLGALGWHGVAMVEFKRDSRDGSLRLMEINARFWGSLQLAIDAGVDFPAILLSIAQGRPVAPRIGTHRVGVRSRWWWGDVDALLAVLFKSRRGLNLPADHPGRLATLRDFLKLWGRDLHYEVERWDDPRPGLLEARRWFFGSR
jgi:predicted ATP-grasp superfamily ATP-dependent carboligase